MMKRTQGMLSSKEKSIQVIDANLGCLWGIWFVFARPSVTILGGLWLTFWWRTKFLLQIRLQRNH